VTKEALATFDGVGRRFTVIGEVAGVTLIDDYAHHPAEISATLDAARNAYPVESHRIIGVFQPHRYSRTRDLFDAFARAFNQTDVLYVTDIYRAGESPIDGITSARLVDAIRGYGHQDVELCADKDEVPERIAAIAKAGDVVISLGAGDINRILGDLGALLGAEVAEAP
jgi:UDP-N-acetylmuramate--alanine ligase